MAIDPKWFIWCNEHNVKEGTVVKYDDELWVVYIIYFGQEETLRVRHIATGEEKSLFPAEGLDDVVVMEIVEVTDED